MKGLSKVDDNVLYLVKDLSGGCICQNPTEYFYKNLQDDSKIHVELQETQIPKINLKKENKSRKIHASQFQN